MSKRYSDDLRDLGPDRQVTGFTLGWLFWGMALLFFIGASGIAGNFVMGWLSKPAQVLGADNVQEQWRFAYDYRAKLDAAARQVCDAEILAAKATGDVQVQRESQVLALRQNYQRIASDYDGRLADAFRAKLVAPPDVPQHAPILEDSKRRVCQ